jgi:hypothetical protein
MEAAKAEMKARMAEAKLKHQQNLNQVSILILQIRFSAHHGVYQ